MKKYFDNIARIDYDVYTSILKKCRLNIMRKSAKFTSSLISQQSSFFIPIQTKLKSYNFI